MIDRLEQMEQRYEELSTQLSQPEIINDHEKYQKAGRALREIESPVEKFRELKQVRAGLEDARAMLTESDAEMKAMAQEEIATLEPQRFAAA
jgi:peptide chain release factor 1